MIKTVNTNYARPFITVRNVIKTDNVINSAATVPTIGPSSPPTVKPTIKNVRVPRVSDNANMKINNRVRIVYYSIQH